MLVAGGRGAGKITFTKHLLKEGNWLIHPTPERIIWCCAKHQPNLQKELKEIVQAIEYVHLIPSEKVSLFDRNVNNLIILDETIDDATQDKRFGNYSQEGDMSIYRLSTLQKIFFKKNQR